MKVSLITATYNSEATISDTVKSINSQEYPDVEHIIVDGESKDDTLKLVKQLSLVDTKIICEGDNGIYDALNKGINASTGDIIGFIHSDDFFDTSRALSIIVDRFLKFGCDGVYADLAYVSANDTNKILRNWKSGHFNKKRLRYGWMPPHPTFYMKKKIYQQLGGFKLEYSISADYESMLRYLSYEDFHVEYIPKVLVKMRSGGVSNRNLKTICKKSYEDLQALREHNLPAFKALVCKNISKIPQFF